MTQLQIIEQIIGSLNTGYKFEYEESSMMNVKADDYKRGDSFVYVEEFRQGRITEGRYGGKSKEMKLQIYFCKFCELHNDARQREKLREQILADIVYPFIDGYKKAGYEDVSEWGIYYPLPRFDGNEVSVMLEFMAAMPVC